MNDPLANALSGILNDEKRGSTKNKITPSSKIIKKVLGVIKDNHYIGDFEEINNGRGNEINVNLLGNINKCGVIKPRYSVKHDKFEKYEERYLLAKEMGILIKGTFAGNK